MSVLYFDKIMLIFIKYCYRCKEKMTGTENYHALKPGCRYTGLVGTPPVAFLSRVLRLLGIIERAGGVGEKEMA